MPTLQELHNDIEREGTQETGWSVGDAIAKRVSEEVGHALDASGTAGAADLRYNGVGKVLEILGALPQEIAAQIKVPAPDPAAIAAAIPADIAQEVADEIAKRLQPTDKPAV